MRDKISKAADVFVSSLAYKKVITLSVSAAEWSYVTFSFFQLMQEEESTEIT